MRKCLSGEQPSLFDTARVGLFSLCISALILYLFSYEIGTEHTWLLSLLLEILPLMPAYLMDAALEGHWQGEGAPSPWSSTNTLSMDDHSGARSQAQEFDTTIVTRPLPWSPDQQGIPDPTHLSGVRQEYHEASSHVNMQTGDEWNSTCVGGIREDQCHPVGPNSGQAAYSCELGYTPECVNPVTKSDHLPPLEWVKSLTYIK